MVELIALLGLLALIGLNLTILRNIDIIISRLPPKD